MIKFKVGKFSKTIKKVEVNGESKTSVFFYRTARGETKEVRDAKDTEWSSYHDTFDEAKDSLISALRLRVDSAEKSLAIAKRCLDKVMNITDAQEW